MIRAFAVELFIEKHVYIHTSIYIFMERPLPTFEMITQWEAVIKMEKASVLY